MRRQAGGLAVEGAGVKFHWKLTQRKHHDQSRRREFSTPQLLVASRTTNYSTSCRVQSKSRGVVLGLLGAGSTTTLCVRSCRTVDTCNDFFNKQTNPKKPLGSGMLNNRVLHSYSIYIYIFLERKGMTL
jgi:hypothetical protein